MAVGRAVVAALGKSGAFRLANLLQPENKGRRHELLQFILSGLAIGSIYGLVAMALAISFYVTRVINFSQGQMLTIAIMISAGMASAGHLWLGILLGVLTACLVGIASYFIAVRPILLIDRFSFGWLVSTLGLGLAIENGIAFIAGPISRPYPPLLNETTVHFGDAVLTGQQVLAIVVAMLFAVAFELFRRFTFFGKTAMATAADPEMAASIGINTTVVAVATFMISGLFAGVAGILIAPRTFANPYLGGTFNTFAFVAMMIGGTERPVAAMFGGIFLGIVAEGANSFINSQASDWFPYLVLIVVLLVTPRGLFSSDSPLSWLRFKAPAAGAGR